VSETGRRADDISEAFVRENRRHVRTLTESLASVGEAPDRETVDEAFRAAHSLKANCELVGLDDVAAVAHAVEDVLAAARAGDAALDEPVVETAVAAVEAIGRVLDGGRGDGDLPAIEVDEWTERLRGHLGEPDAVGAETAGAAPDGDTETESNTSDGTESTADPSEPDLDDLGLDEEARAAFETAGEYDDLDALVAAMDDDAEAYADLEGGGSFDEVEAAAEAEATAPDDDTATEQALDADPAAEPESNTPGGPATDGAAIRDAETDAPVASAADRSQPERSREALPAPDPEMAPVTAGTPNGADGDGPSGGAAIPGLGRVPDAAATIAESSLDAERFDIDPDEAGREPSPAPEPLGAVRGLAIERRRLATALGDADDDGPAADALASLRDATAALRETVAGDLRRLDALAPDLERTVERAGRHVETPVEFVADIAPVAVDHTVVDRLSEPLVHCVRNAVDHGIEEPRERGAAGKPEAGTVTVRGRRDGERLVVTVEDDGRGIDAEAVHEAAVDAGIEGAADATDDEALDLLFEAGLSTADGDSALSGRGVGMDVVGRAMADLDGEVTVDSTPGEGTTVRLSVPVGNVVERVQLVAVGGETYAVPEWPLEETMPASEARVQNGAVRVSADELERDAMGTETAFGSTVDYRVVDLVAALGVPEAAADAADEHDGQREPAYLLVDPPDGAGGRDQPGSGHVALRCDGVLSEHETLVTPLRGVDASPAVDGAVVCDDGRVVPALDPRAFVGGR
jgi:two-component system chemotaxis sensor kinase CheA